MEKKRLSLCSKKQNKRFSLRRRIILRLFAKANTSELRRGSHRTLFVLLSFLIPFVIVILGDLALHMAPFGDHMLLISDAKVLYASDLAFIQRVLRGQEDVLYSFKSGIGMNLMGANSGLLNPANVIVMLFDITSWPEMYTVLMAIDIAVCGLTMFLFLSHVYGWKGQNLIFSTVYAMMGFNVAYCYHYNFILSPELLPLIALGIHYIVKGKGPWLYIISLGYAIFASFYFGYMLCIASVVLFLFWYIRDRKNITDKRRIWINYIGGSLVAGLLPAIVWAAALLSLSGGRLGQNTIFDFTFQENMSFADACAKFFIGANSINEQVNGQPNVFIGSLVLFLNFVFFTDRHNNIRKKITYALPLVFYFITFYIRAFSMAVQGFSQINWFNYRYSFVFSFFMLMIAYEEFPLLREVDVTDFKKACGAFALFLVFVFGQRYSFITGGGMLLGLVFLMSSLAVIWWNRTDSKRAPERIMVMILVLLCSIESYANYVICTGKLRTWESDLNQFRKDLFYGSVVSEAVQSSDPGFFRMADEHATNAYASNDSRLFGYNGLDYFGSCESDFVYQGLSKLGMSRWNNRMWYAGGKPNVFDSLLGLKYVVSENNLAEEKNYEYKIEIDGHKLFLNRTALPIAMLTARDNNALSLTLNPFENHNALWKSLTGQEANIFNQQTEIQFIYRSGLDGAAVDREEARAYSASVSAMTVSENVSDDAESSSASESVSAAVRDIKAIQSANHIECTFTAEYDGPIYAYTGLAIDEKQGYLGEAMYCIGTFQKGDTVTDYIPLYTQASEEYLNLLCAEYYVAYPNQAVLGAYSEQLQQNAGTLEKIKDSHLDGHITANGKNRLFFTIPYDEGWILTVDGREAPLEKTADLFMSANIEAGEHDYEMRFIPRGMRTGMYISFGGLTVLVLLVVFNVLERKRKRPVTTTEET